MTPSIRFGRFELQPTERRLLADGQPLALGGRAFDVLLVLAEQRGALVNRADLLDRVWPDVVVEENNLQVQVSALRKVLGAPAIANIPGRGYRLAIAVEGATPASRFEPSAATLATNVPRALAPLIGRDAELAALDALLARQRLVSLVGPGGIGKTRLAQALALQRATAHAQGAWLVALAALPSAERIAPAVAAALRVELRGDSAAATQQLARSLAAHDALLVLDNCEHLIDGAAALVRALLDASASLRILVTSQEPLRLADEQVVRVGALSLPATGSTLEVAMGHGALQLLVQRARQADRRFELTAETLEAAIVLVRRLDGIPLAIGMAAARLPALGLRALNERLAERLNWLRSAERDVPARQSTLRAALDWSHSLLDAASRAVLRRLSVFVGSFDLDSALTVAQGEDGDLDADAALDALSELVHKSLLGVEGLEPPRYRLLESTRLYAAERLAEAGETEAARRRHALAMVQRAEQALGRYWLLSDGAWMAAFEPDADDLEAAADRAVAAGDAQNAAAPLEALMALDAQRGVDATRRGRMRSALALLPQASGAARARLAQCVLPHPPIALAEIGRVAAVEGAVAAWRAEGDAQRTYDALTSLGYELGLAGRHAEALAALDEARAIEQPRWPPRLRQQLASRAGCVAGFAADVVSYRRDAQRALELAEAAGDQRGALRHRLSLVDAALMAGDDAQAITLGDDVVAQLGQLDAPSLLATALLNLCAAQLRRGDDAGARRSAARSLPLAWQHEQAGFLVDHLALLAARQGQHDAAAQLAAWSDVWYPAHGHQREANEARALQEAGTLARDALGPDGWARAAVQGAALDDARALALARAITGAA